MKLKLVKLIQEKDSDTQPQTHLYSESKEAS